MATVFEPKKDWVAVKMHGRTYARGAHYDTRFSTRFCVGDVADVRPKRDTSGRVVPGKALVRHLEAEETPDYGLEDHPGAPSHAESGPELWDEVGP